MLIKYFYCMGIFIRNNSIFRHYDFLKKSQHWSIDELLAHQFDKLKSLIEYAYKNSEYYRAKYDNNNIKPEMIKSLADFKKIPPITKDELLNHAHKIQIKNGSEKLFYSETSGSTGKPLVFYRNKDWDAWHRASIFRGYSWYNVNPWERNGYFWGYNIAFKKKIKTTLLDMMQNRFRLFSYKDEEISAFTDKLSNASFLSGYSSMIYEVAKKINSESNKQRQFHLKMIKGTSEKIFDTYQEEVERAFGKKMISEYGAAEAGIIAFECPKGNMHINMETVIVEEENNEILVTNLVSKSFPIIRYKLGDYIAIDRDTKCECGMQHYIIKEILGRVGKVIYGSKDQYPSLTLYYVFKNLAMDHNIILNYQAIQSQKGTLKVNIESSLGEQERNLLNKEFVKYFQDDLSVVIVGDVDLKSTNRKKTDFISEV